MNVKRWISVTADFEALHAWPGAKKIPPVSFLQYPHRHKFYIELRVSVSHADRQLEFFVVKAALEKAIANAFDPTQSGLLPVDLGALSCEMIADKIAEELRDRNYTMELEIRVSEDGENGAICTYSAIQEGLKLKVRRVDSKAILPTRAYEGDSCYDIYAVRDVIIQPGSYEAIPTGLALEPPVGYGVQLRGRSSYGCFGKLPYMGTMDNGYRGEVALTYYNFSKEPVEIKVGDKIGQLWLEKVAHYEVVEVDELSESERGNKGFGSSDRAKAR